MVWICILTLYLIGCNGSKDEDRFAELLAKSPHSGVEAVCGTSNAAAFRILGNSDWADSAEIKYFIEYEPIEDEGILISNYFNSSDKKYVKDISAKVFKKWQPNFGKPIREVANKKDANMLLVFKLIDGVGRHAALTDFAKTKDEFRPRGERFMLQMRFDLYDCWKVVKDRDLAKYNFEYICKHEAGHGIFNLMHNDDYSIMNENKKWKDIQFDDVFASRLVFKKYENFDFDGNRYTWITNSNKQVTLNFKQSELYTRCQYPNNKGHFLSTKTIAGLQYLRTAYNCPIKINSSYRHLQCNKDAAGATYSMHIFSNALDFRFIGQNAKKATDQYIRDVRLNGTALQMLLNLGIRGLGSYPSGAFHLDSRLVPKNGGNKKAFGIDLIVWGLMVPQNENAFNLTDDFSKYD